MFKIITMKFLILLFSLQLLFNFSFAEEKNEKANRPEWALKLADAVISRHDSLIYYQRDKPKYEYDYAFLGSAIGQLAKYDEKYMDYMKSYIDYFVEDDGNINGFKLADYNLDRIRPGFNMITLYETTGELKYKLAVKNLVSQLETQPKTKSGGFWHKKRYSWQMWLDGIYMYSPFLTRYAVLFNQPEWLDEVTFQLKLIYEKTLDSSTGLIYHAWDESREQRWSNPQTGQSQHFWSRGTGWYMMALVDVLEYLPKTNPSRESLIKVLDNLSSALLKVRDPETGLWYQVLDKGGKEGNYIETSGSAMFIYAFAKGAKKGYLNDKYFKIAEVAFDSLTANYVHTGNDGLPDLYNTCGACGLGGNPYREGNYMYYISEKQVVNDQKGIAPLILASIALNR